MGLGDLFGGGQESKPALPSRIASLVLLASLFPGMQDVWGSGKARDIVGEFTGDNEFTSIMGKGGNTLLPSLKDLGRYDTFLGKYDAGKFSDTQDQFIAGFLDSLGFGSEGGGIQITGGGGGVASPNIGGYTAPDNVGEYTKRIYESLPDNFRQFVDNVFADSSPEAIDRELDNLSEKLLAEAERNADSIGAQLLDAFAAEGIASSGSALAAMKQLALDTAINANAEIARSRVAALDTLLRQKEVARATLETLLNSGETERAQDVQGQIAELDSKAQVAAAQVYANAQVQQSLIDAQARLALGKLQIGGDIFRSLMAESDAQEKARIAALNKPYDILTALATGMPSKTSQGGNLLGDLLGAGAMIGSAFIDK